MKRFFKILLPVLMLSCASASAGQNDAASVETEALEIADRLRCLVCSDENIESAGDETAADMRLFIRKHLTDGKTQDMVVHLLLAQYGDMLSPEDAPAPNADNERLFVVASFVLCLAAMAFYIGRRSKNFQA